MLPLAGCKVVGHIEILIPRDTVPDEKNVSSSHGVQQFLVVDIDGLPLVARPPDKGHAIRWLGVPLGRG